ncbi:hypothetical protein CDL12_00604 [Handroanthus impetiginosus]|uniref:Putative plant transposon protein domain-containing protein n=1 Tax=Handroanthus impetiginosus TaxID=429701 RepID=A0A2G9IA45_9LAMI|nr:hypothetical protein CDL12_00604 [Handroanthus impetiginosus]
MGKPTPGKALIEDGLSVKRPKIITTGCFLDRVVIRKRGIKDVDEIVERRHWEEFINDPGVANKTLVREFYANLKFTDQQHHAITIRGKSVNFSARTINSLFDTPSINSPGKLQKFLEDHPPLDTICELICMDDPQWTLSRLNKPIYFSRTKLTIVVMKECTVMIFAILTDVPFDIGRFLHRSIWKKSAMRGLSIGLYHSSLITALCALADEYGLIRWVLWTDQMNIPMSSHSHYQPDEPAAPPLADMRDE